MTEDFLERLHMADQDDDEDDLKQLKQLRQVWLAMPEEEPPSRGLDALMAAARTKAEEMKPAPWWRRMLSVMVTPPALALATVIVVAGGAVLVHNHRDEVEVHERAEGQRADEPTDGLGNATGGAAQGSAAVVATPPLETKTLDDVSKREKQDVDAKAVVDAPAKRPKPAMTKKPSSAHAGSKGGDAFGDEETLKLSPRAEPPPPPPRPPPMQQAPVEKPADKAMPDSGMAGPGAAAPTMSTTNSSSTSRPMAVQLLAKARAAAEKGDCATVKQLLEQIAKLDGAYYRSTAAKDATVGRCMQIAD